MSTITFTVHEDGRDYWRRTYSVELETEDYADIEAMRDAAVEMVDNHEIDCSDEDTTDSDTDETELDEDDYSEDADDYEWDASEDATPEPPAEGLIKW